jgi:hypothetical protein
MLHKIQHARSGGVLHGARPGWLKEKKERESVLEIETVVESGKGQI